MQRQRLAGRFSRTTNLSDEAVESGLDEAEVVRMWIGRVIPNGNEQQGAYPEIVQGDEARDGEGRFVR